MDYAFLNSSIPLITGYILDLTFGDPHWFPHPVKGFGWLITWGEGFLNKGKRQFIKGLAMSLILIALAFAIIYCVQHYVAKTNTYAQWIFDSLVVYFCLANRNLIDEGKAVFHALEQNLDAGRKRLSWIVGRDTSHLTENQVRIAVFETMSENLSDGVIAPLFFYALGGVPAMVAYKMISTLDSMIGYKNERYEKFGKFAARADDVANYIPARVTAIFIAVVSMSKQSFRYIFKYGNKHASPNSGYPEAAMAGYLNCRFGGPNYYHGVLVEKPYIGDDERIIDPHELSKVVLINHLTASLTICIVILFSLIL
jgi:adenosylcobinamide-phosphate synthase